MNDVGFAVVLALAWFATVNVAASVVVAVSAWTLDTWIARFAAPSAARVLLVLRLTPGIISVFFAVALFLPAHWRLEPAGAEETAGYSLILLAGLGAVILGTTVWRTVAALNATDWIGRVWLKRSERLPETVSGVPVHRVVNTLPILSLVGVFRPRLFVSTPVLEALTPAELQASFAHEVAHLRARDNFKRILVACSPDVLSLGGIGRRVEDQWRAALEFAADAAAVGQDRQRALDLVAALVKVARLMPAPKASLIGAESAFYDGALLRARIDRLMQSRSGRPSSFALLPMWPVSLAGVLLLAAMLPSHAVWVVVHIATEGLVRLLP